MTVVFITISVCQVTRSLRKADVVVGCHSPREGLENGAVVSVTEAWILGMYRICRSIGRIGV